MADRYVVIVPRSSPETYEYLSESFRSLPEVQIVLDRRAPSPDVRRLVERRGDESRLENDAFGCRLIRVDGAIDAKASNAGPVPPLRSGSGTPARARLRHVGLRDA
jgi:hypothetical protein